MNMIKVKDSLNIYLKAQMVRTKYIAIVLLLVWILSMIYMTFTVNNSSGGGWNIASSNAQNELLEKALKEAARLREENVILRNRVNGLRIEQNVEKEEVEKIVEIVQAKEPSLPHEILRRRVAMDVRETWFFVHDQLLMLKKDVSAASLKRVNNMLENLFEYYSMTSNDLNELSSVDGADHWRLKESQELADIIFQVLEKLQNPANCSQSRILLCNLGKGCGFGCQVHHLTYCLITSLATNRTLVIDSKNWRYLDNGWSKFFVPPSRTCKLNHSSGGVMWGAQLDSERVLKLPIIDTINPQPNFLPLAVPKQLSERLVRLHGDPFVWWAGQMVKYLMRPQPLLKKEIEENQEKLKFMSGKGVVGVHIRRTDKVASEAAFHALEEYMNHVEKYFDMKDLGGDQPMSRSIYLASDEPNVFEEAASKYPNYLIYGNRYFSKTASLSSRYTEASLKAVIMDIYFLSMCDYLVCTFSSQVCRLAYELMQTMHGDASNRFISLDDIYYFGGQLKHIQIARLNHLAKDSGYLSLRKGDHIMVAGNHWNGYSMGNLFDSRGLYPSFKVLEHLDLADFPLFDEYFKVLNSSVSPKPTPDPHKNHLKFKKFQNAKLNQEGLNQDNLKRT